MTDLIFRDARPQDIAIVLALADAGHHLGPAHRPRAETYGDERYRAAFDEIAADPNNNLIVAERGGEIIGTLQITIIPGLTNFGLRRGLLENVHIRADQRGFGLGTKLLEHAIGICRGRGCKLVQLTSNKVRHEAHRFYARLGFEPSHEGFKLKL